jgi:hypothetical protein
MPEEVVFLFVLTIVGSTLLRREIGDLGERIDFTERLIAKRIEK